jgi:long-subunit acyl-CoA synthetase (AMP-forming)
MSLGFKPQETASILSNTVIEWVLADLAVLSCGGVSNGIYPTDAASQVHYLCEDSRTTRVVRRRRRAARQGARGARAACRCCARSWCSTWKACTSWTTPA